MDEYAPVRNTFDNRDNITDDLYNADEYYYVDLVMKEWNMCPTDVGKLYFSITNIKRIQKGIKREIYNRSYSKFRLLEDQNVMDLLTAMRAVYKWYSKDLPTHIKSQVKVLNEQTIQYVAPGIMDNLKQYYGYLDDIKNPIRPIEQPINVNRGGRRLLPGSAQVIGL